MKKIILTLVAFFCTLFSSHAHLIERARGDYECNYGPIHYYVHIESWISVPPESFLVGFIETPEMKIYTINSKLTELSELDVDPEHYQIRKDKIDSTETIKNHYTRANFEIAQLARAVYLKKSLRWLDETTMKRRGYLFFENNLYIIPHFEARIGTSIFDSLPMATALSFKCSRVKLFYPHDLLD